MYDQRSRVLHDEYFEFSFAVCLYIKSFTLEISSFEFGLSSLDTGLKNGKYLYLISFVSFRIVCFYYLWPMFGAYT